MILSFARFDITNFVTPVRRVLPSAVLVLAVAVAAPWPAFAIGAAAIVMSLLAANPFAADERGRLDTLYATLPITRRTIVVGRYLGLVGIYLVLALAATVAAIVTTLLGHHPVDPVMLGAVNVAAFSVFAIAIAVQLPFFFSVGYTRARPMMFVPAAVLVAGSAIASQTGILNHTDLIHAVSQNLDTLWVAAPVIAVAALAASAGISWARYRRRSL
jgi:ABC-type transport system involved in multi-copper enzyme maturation permease subunit